MKKLLTSLLVAGVLVGAVYGAAASISLVGVDDLGSQDSSVATTANVTDVGYDLDPADIKSVIGVTVALSADTGLNDEVCVQVTDGATVLANGCKTPGVVLAGGAISVVFDATPHPEADAELIDGVEVTIIEAN